MVNLSSNNSNNINLSGQTQRNVNISTPNTNNVDANTMGNSQRARSWAIGEGLIDGEDYSAKHYAQQAKVSEDIASGAISNIEEIEQQALDSITTGIGEIETAKEGALSLIDTTKDDAIDDIDTAKSNALIDIETSATNKITLINNTASSFEADLTLLTQRAETAATDAQASADYIVNNAPEATIQQTSTGAIITTKDLTHGITTATILNGAKGDKGDTGERGETGATGTSVTGVNLLSTVGKINTYRMNFSNGTYFDYDVTDGADGGVTIDQTFDGTSANAQSGVAIAGELNNYVKSSAEDTEQGITSSIGYLEGFAPSMLMTQGDVQFVVTCGEGASLFAINNNTGNQVILGVAPNGVTIIHNNQQALLTLSSNNNLTVNGTEVQPLLVSGTNIKTINNESILGSGDISINADNIFWATYGTTTYTDIMTAINDGKLVLCTYNGNTYYYIGLGNNEVSFVTNTVGTNYMIHVDSSDNWTNDSRAIPTFISDLTDNTSSYPIDKARSVVDQNSGSVKMWTGTKAEYDAIATKDTNTLYNITDDNTADAYEAYTKSEADTLLGNKADIDFTNVTNSAKITMANASMPSDIYVALTLGASGTQYTAPADGWVYLRGKASAVGQYVVIVKPNNPPLEASVMWSVATNTDMYVNAPVRKGEIYRINYTMGGTSTVNYLRFYYAQGSESEAL